MPLGRRLSAVLALLGLAAGGGFAIAADKPENCDQAASTAISLSEAAPDGRRIPLYLRVYVHSVVKHTLKVKKLCAD